MLNRIISLFLCAAMIVSMLPVQAIALESNEDPTEVVLEEEMTVEDTTAPTETETEPTEDTTAPTEVVTEPTEETTAPTEVVTEPTEETTAPTEAVTEPTEETTAPTEAVTEPTEETTAPTEAVTEPTEETTAPTEAVTDPTEETTAPTEAVTEPTEETTAPTEAVTEPTEETIAPTEAVTEPTEPAPVMELQSLENAVSDEDGVAVFEAKYSYSGTEEVHFQWQKLGDDGQWIDLSGETGSVLTIAGITEENIDSFANAEYRCVLTAGDEQWITNAAKINLAVLRIAIAEAKAASNAADFKYTVITLGDGQKAASITGYSGTDTEIVIPDAIDGYPVVRIAKSSFYNKTSITTVVIPEGVTELEDGSSYGAFYGCSGLTTVSLPSTLTKIGYGSFNGCTLLTDIVLPENLETIGWYAFSGCSSLTELNFPDGLTTIGNGALNGTGITKLKLPDSVTSVSLSGLSGQLTYLRWTAGIPVISSNTGFFNNWDKLETVILPEGVTGLENAPSSTSGAFYDCDSLKTVTLPSTLEKIGSRAFYGCDALTEITIPGSVPAIGDSAFSTCKSLIKVTLHKGLKSIGQNAFDYCESLTELELPEGLETIGSNALGYTAISRLELPDTVTSVNLRGLQESLTYIRWTAGIPVVPKGTFNNYAKLETAILPAGVTELEDGVNNGVFYNCSNLKTVTLPSTLTKIGYCCFDGCGKLTDIALPENLETIGWYAFSGCSSLTELNFPDGLTTIGNGALDGTGITKLELSDSVTSVSLSGLSGQLMYLRWTAGIPVISNTGSFYNWDKLETVILPEGVTELSDGSNNGAFYDCDSLKTVTLPSTLTKIGSYSFYSCDALTEIAIPASVSSIGNYAFYYCSSLTEVELQEGLKTIGSNAFNYCKSLTELELPEGLETIGSNALGYTAISRLELPDTVTSVNLRGLQESLTYIRWTAGIPIVPNSTFCNFSVLETVILPEGITELADSTSGQNGIFYNCSNLKTVTLPSTLTKIGSHAFSGCSLLTNVILPPNLKTIGRAAFLSCKSITELNCPDGLTTIDTSALSGTGITKLELSDSVTSVSLSDLSGQLTYLRWTAGIPIIEPGTFTNYDKLETVIIPEGITELKDPTSGNKNGAFYDCNSLKTVTLPSTLTKIGNFTFSGCDALSEIVIPASVTSIGNSAFSGCKSLTKVTLHKGLKSIGQNAFYYCESLTELELPEGLETIGHSALGYTAISRLELPDTVTSVNLSGLQESLTYIRWTAGIPVLSNTGSFYNWDKLETVILPEGVTELSDGINNGAFYDCDSLKSISLPSTLTKIGNCTFTSCDALAEITIPASVGSIGNSAFSGCKSLTKVTLNEGLKTIGNNAFNSCKALTALELPEGLETIGNSALGYTAISRLELPDSITSVSLRGLSETLTYLRWTSGIPVVPKGSFTQWEVLETVIFPEGVTVLENGDTNGGWAYCSGIFYNCKSLVSVSLPSTLTQIGSHTFYGCENLEEIQIGSNVSSIGNFAFDNIPYLSIKVWPDTWAEEYMIEKGIDYLYCSDVDLSGTLEVTLDSSVYSGMDLVLNYGESNRSVSISGESSYLFTQLPVNEVCTVRIVNSHGDVVAQAEDITVAQDTTVTISRMTLGTVNVTLAEELDEAILSGMEINWYDGEELYATGFPLKEVPKGKVLTCRVSLNDVYGCQYWEPEDIAHTVTAGNQTVVISLEPVSKVVLSGKITDGTEPVAGATVTVEQLLNGKYEIQNTAETDKDGIFAVTVPAVASKLTAYASGYSGVTMDVDASAEDTDLGEIALGTLTGAEVTVNIRFKPVDAEATTLSSLDKLNVSVYNLTKEIQINHILQGTALILSQNADAGDTLNVSVSSATGEFAEVSRTVTLDETLKGSVDLELTQYGSIAATIVETNNEAVRMLIYDKSGALADSVSVAASQKKVTSGSLADGEYTVVLLGESQLLMGLESFGILESMGLSKGTDYAMQTVSVHSGSIQSCIFGSVPALNESKFYFTDPEQTVLTSNRTTVSAGKYFTLKASTAFKDQYQDKTSDIKWIVEFPEGTEYYPGTVTVDKQQTNSEQTDNLLIVPVDDLALDLRLCVFATGQGTVSPAVYLEFLYDGNKIRQLVGVASVEIEPFTFDLTEKTFSPTVFITGTSAPNTEIFLYDNNVLIGQTKSSFSGNWFMTADLYKPGSYSKHKLYAQVNLSTGTKVCSTTQTVVYQYSPNPAIVNTVSMYSGGTLISVLDFKNNTVQGSSYTVGISGSASCTFMIDFLCEDISLLSDVMLEVIQEDGTIRPMETVYNEETGYYVTSGMFYLGTMPVNFGVSYVYDGELIVAQEELDDLEIKISEMDKIGQILSGINTGSDTDILELVEIDPEIFDIPSYVDVPEEVYRNLENYNQSVEELRTLLREFNDQFEELYGTITVHDESITATGGLVEILLSQQILPDYSPQDKINDGYKPYQTGKDPDEQILKKESSDGNSTVEEKVITPDGKESSATTKTAENVTSKEIVDKVAAIMNTVDAIGDVVGTVRNLQKGLGNFEDSKGAIQEICDKRWIKYNEKLGIWLDGWDNGDPIEQNILKQELDIEFGKITKLEKIGKTIAKGADVIGTVADVFTAVTAPSNIKNDIHEFQEMFAIYNKTGNPEAMRLMTALSLRIATEGISFLGAALGIAGVLSPLVFGAAAVVTWPYALAAGIVGAVYLLSRTDQGINDDIRRTKERYGKTNANALTPLRVVIDPSGYLYEAVESNRLQDVTVTCYERVTKYDIYDEPYEEVEVWDATYYDQVNPMTTDVEGRYAWDVPEGWWQVKAELDGYETVYSDWLQVPPPRFDINLGMVSYAVPEIAAVTAQPESVDVEFSRYMIAETLTAESICVSVGGSAVTGTIELLNAEVAAADANQMLASKVRFVPETPLSNDAEITVTVSESVLSYSNVAVAADESAQAVVEALPESLIVPETVELVYLDSTTISIQAQPADLAAGKTVHISVASDMFLAVEESTVTLDEQGMATVHIAAKLPGETELTCSMGDGSLQEKIRVQVLMPDFTESIVKVENRVSLLTPELGGQMSVWIDGREYTTAEEKGISYVDLSNSNAKTMVVHTYGTINGKQYPLGMKVWMLTNEDGYYTAKRTEELDNILGYEGCSIRVTGNQGIRMITSIDEVNKDALTGEGLAGYTLKEYGTAIAWASQISNTKPLTLSQSYVSSNYAYSKAEGKDPIFAYANGRMQYTNVLVGFSLDQCSKDLAMRPYMILEDAAGNDLTLYGGIVERSIGYIALQNQNIFAEGTEEYDYIMNIINHVYGEDNVA